MDHVAIMRKSWKLTEKILTGEKSIESRWYKTRYAPWARIHKGDSVYFKDSGEPARLQARVQKVLQFQDLTPARVQELLQKYARADGIEKKDIPAFFERFKDKKYCILIFLKNPRNVEPFEINKKGFGAMASWIIVKNAKEIKLYKQETKEKGRHGKRVATY
ncbi:MAG: hypothetical protein Greene071421_258 [Parcubacteria group bacterium Greene0714_21]|nr:MAG: hypothetical protein Greene041639_277 [Parcubacteria group bacterium Greene0416_39]TSC97546.1 MAG: hypothetical protein Greene101447_471 [Parcubacteria group bacterium Greene1014_47]TSD04422.1 MAG: hypothetical protein Greene071421_258 [Parcubacteria group bacterium Greene0714_21]